MNHQRAAEIQVLLEGIRLPATRHELLRYAAHQDPAAERELAGLPDREYESLDEVGEELVRVQPRPLARVPPPRPESGEPPGGDDYLNPSPRSGAVRGDSPAAPSAG